MPAYRSFLFAPGNHARKVVKVFDCGADNVILDLEDAVAKTEKVATRALVVEALKRPRSGGAYIRVNAFSTEFCYGDAVAVVGPGLDGIILPTVESREQIVAFDWLVGALERERGLQPGGIDIIPIIETAKGIANARAIAAAGTRVRRMAFGAGDYTLDLGMEWTLTETELEHARAEMVVASRSWVHRDREGGGLLFELRRLGSDDDRPVTWDRQVTADELVVAGTSEEGLAADGPQLVRG